MSNNWYDTLPVDDNMINEYLRQYFITDQNSTESRRWVNHNFANSFPDIWKRLEDEARRRVPDLIIEPIGERLNLDAWLEIYLPGRVPKEL